MHKHARHAVVASVATGLGAVAFLGLMRQSGDASSGATIHVEIVDRCGQVVRHASGEPVIVEFQLEPPPIDRIAGNGTVAAQAPLSEEEVLAAAIPADIRQVAGLNC